MRLLVHGGIGYYERQRIGEWPDSILRGTLEDTYRLSKDGFAFGMGPCDNSAFLIARTLVSFGDRPYAVSILIDPGPVVWAEYGWNGAHLALSLFEREDSLGRSLVTDPESFRTDRDLQNLFTKVTPATLNDHLPVAQAFLDFWVGAGAIRTSEHIVLTPDKVGFPAQPDLRMVASQLDLLRECFRPGCGWLVGGSKTHGKVFGTQVVFDDGPALTPDAIDEDLINSCIEEGGRLLSSYETVWARENLRVGWEKKMESPIWLWTREEVFPPEKLFDDLNLLAEILNASETLSSEMVDAKIDDANLKKRLADGGPLDMQIRESALEMALSVHGSLPKERTLFVLYLWLELKGKISEDTPARLDPATVANQFAVRIRDYPLLTAKLQRFRPDVRSQVWKSLISEEGPESLVKRMEMTIDDLRTDRSNEQDSDEQIRRTLVAGLERAHDLNLPLTIWCPWQGKNPAWPLMEELLLIASRTQAECKVGNWTPGYLAFGHDDGGHELYRYHGDNVNVAEEIAGEMMGCLFAEIGAKGEIYHLYQEAVKWLNAVATSPLRGCVPIGYKKRITELDPTEREGWKTFCAVYSLYSGAKNERSQVSALDSGEKERLCLELDRLTRDDSGPCKFTPNLPALSRLLGEDNLLCLGQLEPKLRRDDIEPWLTSWERIDPNKKYPREVMRIILEQEHKVSPKSLGRSQGLSDDKLVELFEELLCGGNSDADTSRRDRFKEISGIFGSETRFREAVSEAFQHCTNVLTKRSDVVRRFGRDHKAIECLKKVVPDLQELIVEIEDEWRNEWVSQQTGKLLHLFCDGPEDDDLQSKREIKKLFKQYDKNADFPVAVARSIDKIGDDDTDKQAFKRRVIEDKGVRKVVAALTGPETLNALERQYRLEDYQKRLRAIFHENGQQFDEQYEIELRALLSRTRGDETFKEAVAIELEACLKNSEDAKVFCRRYAWAEGLLNDLFDGIAAHLHRTVMTKWYENNPAGFEEKANKLFKQHHLHSRTPTLYGCAVLYVLMTTAREEKKRIALQHLDRREAKQINTTIANMLGKYLWTIEKGPEAQAEPNNSNLTPTKVGQSVFGSLVHRVLRSSNK